ncbi:MAG: Xcc1710-like domain-containing protein [Gammaproteobacteria bacterium]|nr:Xcc1710-like domain-containing protein [Gammaproteobacteria bacterium]
MTIMQLDREQNVGIVIRSIAAGEIHINDQVIDGPVVLTPEEIFADWTPPPIDELSIADFEPALAIEPEVILFGTGEVQIFPAIALITDIMRRGVGFEIMATPAACRTFNVLAGEGRRVAAALLL